MEKTSSRKSAHRTASGTERHFVAAVILARRGRYTEAVKMLQKAVNAGECSDADALDLHARIYAQQGFYLQAESSWQRAKELDKLNQNYGEALRRLRRARGRYHTFRQFALIISMTIFLGLLFRQIMIERQVITTRLGASEASLMLIRNEIGNVEKAVQRRSKEFATSIDGLTRHITNIESITLDQLKALPTSEDISNDRAALIARFDVQMARLQNSIQRDIEVIETSRAAFDTIQTKRLDKIADDISDIGKLIGMFDERLTTGFEYRDTDLSKRLNSMQDSIEVSIKALSTRGEVAPIGQAMSRVQENVDELLSIIKQLKGNDELRASTFYREGSEDPPAKEHTVYTP